MLAFHRPDSGFMVSEPLKAQVASCVIDKLPRKNERPSDHAPVTVELVLL